jgi:hypothetical protein
MDPTRSLRCMGPYLSVYAVDQTSSRLVFGKSRLAKRILTLFFSEYDVAGSGDALV